MNKNSPVGHVVVDALVRCDALRISTIKPFTLKSGLLSPVYFDCRKLISDPAVMSLVTGLFHYALAEFDYEPRRGYILLEKPPFPVIAGGESAGIPFATRLAASMGLSSAYVRKAQKEYGTKGKVEGASVEDRRVVLVEDLITDAGSKLEFIEALREAGAEVKLCMVVFDRQQGGEKALKEHGVELLSLANIDSLHNSGLVPAEVSDYFSDPAAWDKTFREQHPDRV